MSGMKGPETPKDKDVKAKAQAKLQDDYAVALDFEKLTPEQQAKFEDYKGQIEQAWDDRLDMTDQTSDNVQSTGEKSHSKTHQAAVELAGNKLSHAMDGIAYTDEESSKFGAEAIKAYTDQMAGEDSELGSEEALKVQMHAERMAKVLSDDPEMFDLRYALSWALNLPMDEDDNESMASKKPEAINTVVDALHTAGDRREVATMILDLMDSNDRIEVVKKLDDPVVASELVSQAHLSPTELVEAKYALSQSDLKKLEKSYGERRKLIEGAVKGMKLISYGAENDANRVLTLKNGLRGLGYALGATTLLVNVMASWKHPSSLLTNEYVGLGLAQIGAAYYTGSERKFTKDIQPKGERDIWKADGSQRVMLDELDKSVTGWKKTFEGPNGGLYLSLFGEFRDSIRNDNGTMPYSKLTIAEFIKFMQEKNESKASVFNAAVKGNSATMTDESFRNLAVAFDNLTVAGAASVAKRRYDEVLKESRERKA